MGRFTSLFQLLFKPFSFHLFSTFSNFFFCFFSLLLFLGGFHLFSTLSVWQNRPTQSPLALTAFYFNQRPYTRRGGRTVHQPPKRTAFSLASFLTGLLRRASSLLSSHHQHHWVVRHFMMFPACLPGSSFGPDCSATCSYKLNLFGLKSPLRGRLAFLDDDGRTVVIIFTVDAWCV